MLQRQHSTARASAAIRRRRQRQPSSILALRRTTSVHRPQPVHHHHHDSECITRPDVIKEMWHRILLCVKFIPDRGVIHGELKPRNMVRVQPIQTSATITSAAAPAMIPTPVKFQLQLFSNTYVTTLQRPQLCSSFIIIINASLSFHHQSHANSKTAATSSCSSTATIA